MSCDFQKSELMDYLYEELDDISSNKVEAHLHQCSECMAEIGQLKKMRSFLEILPQENPEERLVFAEKPSRSFSEWWNDVVSILPRTRTTRIGFAAAFSVLFLLVAGSLAQLEVSYDSQSFSISMGVMPRAEVADNTEIGRDALEQIRADAASLVAEAVKKNREQLQEEWEMKLAEYSKAYEVKHETELQKLGITFEEYLQSSNNRMDENSKLLNKIIRSVSSEQK